MTDTTNNSTIIMLAWDLVKDPGPNRFPGNITIEKTILAPFNPQTIARTFLCCYACWEADPHKEILVLLPLSRSTCPSCGSQNLRPGDVVWKELMEKISITVNCSKLH